MKIVKFSDFNIINEDLNDTPEQYIKMALLGIKNKLEAIFEIPEDESESEEKVKKFDDEKEGPTLAEMGVNMESLEMSLKSKTLDNLKLKFSDAEYLYDLFIGIDINEAIPKNGKQFNVSDIKKCFIKFKKYDRYDPGEVLGELTDNIDIDSINQDLLISLKEQLDEQSGGKEEEFKIETE